MESITYQIRQHIPTGRWGYVIWVGDGPVIHSGWDYPDPQAAALAGANRVERIRERIGTANRHPLDRPA